MQPTAVLTRPSGRNEALAARLSAAGWQALILPALVLAPLKTTDPVPAPGDFDLVVFVSGNAARMYLAQTDLPDGWPAATLAATVGPASARALREAPQFGPRGRVVHPPEDAPTHDSEALLQLLSNLGLPRRALLVRGEAGRDWLAERLVEAGVDVRSHVLYRRKPAVWSQDSVGQLRRLADQAQAQTSVWLLTSIASIDATADAVRAAGLFDWWARCRFVVTHPRQEEYLLAIAGSSGQTPMVKTCIPADDSIFQAIVTA
ncbi:MAG: uroporphyrinogen-III synthase [Bordetella sp.]|uniref:uroporphyrinogen-III synthase n=1 Tax=Bordetella sp. TaxID=28081 RepID=UPI003F7BA7A3